MRHGYALRKFSRPSGARKALFRALATALLQHEQIETTLQKAKELRPIVERLITIAKTDTLAHRRSAYGYLTDKTVVHKLFAEIGPRFVARPGGYTRVLRTRHRMGDAAEMAVIALVEKSVKAVKTVKAVEVAAPVVEEKKPKRKKKVAEKAE